MSNIENDAKRLQEEFAADCRAAATPEQIEALRVKYLGRKSQVNELFGQIPGMNPEDKARWGRELNVLKQKFTAAIEDKLKNLKSQEKRIDLTFPGANISFGSRHVLSIVLQDICAIFERMGFDVAEGAECEDEWHNFTALNFPADHPSRDSFDTFYLDLPDTSKKSGKHLLRCHTSPSQVRIMEKNKPPLAVISPGRVYRPDEVDATHSFMFNQVEGFAVDKDINFGNLKGVLYKFAQEFFGDYVNLRFRPHYFPFTEPSAEADVSCFLCGRPDAKGSDKEKCSVCKGKGWLEVLGCGMIHPHVLDFCGIDSKKYQGFAFGMGVERMAMLKYGIHDIRLFTENDVKFLEQFRQV